jgi:hypothetical protein
VLLADLLCYSVASEICMLIYFDSSLFVSLSRSLTLFISPFFSMPRVFEEVRVVGGLSMAFQPNDLGGPWLEVPTPYITVICCGTNVLGTWWMDTDCGVTCRCVVCDGNIDVTVARNVTAPHTFAAAVEPWRPDRWSFEVHRTLPDRIDLSRRVLMGQARAWEEAGGECGEL